MKHLFTVLTAVSVLFVFGCSHHLEVKNLNDYQASSLTMLSKDISLGVTTSNDTNNGQILVTGTARALSQYVGDVVYPYTPSSSRAVDIVSKISVKSDHKGSGANFFINFPGFLVWAPAWNGYVYKPSYDVAVEMLNASDNTMIDTFSIPIRLNVRHADISRTWTEISWLEVGIIGLVGGAVFIQYDNGVTPLLENEIQKTIGDYLAQEIATRLENTSGYMKIIDAKKQLKTSQVILPSPAN